MAVSPGYGMTPAGDGRMRASTADRERAVDVLKAGFAEGRLTKDEYDARVSQAYAARTYAELAMVTADLPGGQMVAPYGQPYLQPYMPVRRRTNSLAVASLIDARLGHHRPPGDLHRAFPFLGHLQQLGCAGEVPAVALGQHVLAHRADVLAGDHPRPDGGLDRHLELLPRDQLLQPGGHGQPVLPRPVGVHDLAERVHGLALQQDVDLHQVGLLLTGGLVVQRGITAGAGLELVEEVEDDLRERHGVADLHPVGGQVLHPEQRAAPALAQLHDRADVLTGRQQRGPDHGLEDLADLAVRELARVRHNQLGARLCHHAVDHVRPGGDQRQVELPLQPLPADVHVQQAEEAAAEAQPQRRRRLRLLDPRGIVEPELVQRVPYL